MTKKQYVIGGLVVVAVVGVGYWLFRPETEEERSARIASSGDVGSSPGTRTYTIDPSVLASTALIGLPFTPRQREVPSP